MSKDLLRMLVQPTVLQIPKTAYATNLYSCSFYAAYYVLCGRDTAVCYM